MLVLSQQLVLEIERIVCIVSRKAPLEGVVLLVIVCQGLPVTGLRGPLVVLKLLAPVLLHDGH